MKTEVKEIYKCDHCNKLYQVKRACIIHEKGCSKSPDNYRVCIGCPHLDKKETTVFEDYYDGEHERKVKLLWCSKIESFLYPPKVEAKKNWFETDPKENQPMRKECEHYAGNESYKEYLDINRVIESPFYL